MNQRRSQAGCRAPTKRLSLRRAAALALLSTILSTLLVLATAGAPRLIHQVLVPHRWCPLHQQIEHVHHGAHDVSCVDIARPCHAQTSVSPGPDDDFRDPPDVCRFSMVSAPAIHPGSGAGAAALSVAVKLVARAPVDSAFARDTLASAPKRSPPAA
ncbi:MAG: hypothetical protein ACOC1F_14580 [Myxococcota bacterium]